MRSDASKLVIGSDEVGWGAVAGPLYVVGVAVPAMWKLAGLKDSKKYADRASRAAIFEALTEEVRGNWALATASATQIDELGAQRCLVEAHTRVLLELLKRHPEADRVIVDGNLRLPDVRQAVAIPKADTNFPAVSAASVLAKVLRDDAMVALARSYPQYGFDKHVGYCTAAHLKAMKKYGLCPHHRRSYLKALVEE